MKILALLLVPSLAFADVPPPAPIPGAPGLPGAEPTSPVAAQPAGGYTVLPAIPVNPSRARKIGGGIVLASGVAMAVIGIALLAARPNVPDISAPGWFDARSSYDSQTVGGFLLIGGGVMAATGGAILLAMPSAPYGELPGAPLLTF